MFGSSSPRISEYERELDRFASKLREWFNDMTEELRESEYRYRTVVDTAADAIITINPDSMIVSWNKGAQDIYGYAESEAIGKNIDDLLAKDDLHEEAKCFSSRLQNGEKLRSIETIRYHKNGTPRHVLLSATPIVSRDNKILGVSLIYKDITDLTRAHLQLLQTEKQATLGVIAGSIGHELNNLVGGLLINAKMLLEKPDDAKRARNTAQVFLTYLEKISLHGRNLLSLSRPTKPKFEALNLSQLLEETTETLILSGVLKHFKVNKNYLENPPMVIGDQNLIEQVVRNLEINAAHATEDGKEISVGVRLSDDKKYIEMYIKDAGHGIPDEIKKKIFEPFFTTKSEGKGTGLGLTIVKQIVDQHHGTLTLESDLGKGTTVTVGLPISQEETEAGIF